MYEPEVLAIEKNIALILLYNKELFWKGSECFIIYPLVTFYPHDTPVITIEVLAKAQDRIRGKAGQLSQTHTHHSLTYTNMDFPQLYDFFSVENSFLLKMV